MNGTRFMVLAALGVLAVGLLAAVYVGVDPATARETDTAFGMPSPETAAAPEVTVQRVGLGPATDFQLERCREGCLSAMIVRAPTRPDGGLCDATEFQLGRCA